MAWYTVLSLLLILSGTFIESKVCTGLTRPISGNGASCNECGRSNLSNDEINAETAYKVITSIRNFPWHASIFYNGNGDWFYVCGGTLITPRVVMTGVNCLSLTPLTPPFVRLVDTGQLRVALGKSTSMWNVTEPSEIRQRVRAILVHPNYRGPSAQFSSNIALLTLDEKVTLSDKVKPACLDFNKNILPPHQKNAIGRTAGFGVTKDCPTLFCNALQYSRDKIMSYGECYDTFQTINFVQYFELSVDSFCFGNGRVSPITKGNAGDGITVIHQGLHYVTGIVSARLEIYNHETSKVKYSMGTVTNLTLYMDWIKSNLPVD